MGCDFLAQYFDAPGGRSNQAKCHTYGRGFTGAIWTEETHNFTAADFQVEILDGDAIAILLG